MCAWGDPVMIWVCWSILRKIAWVKPFTFGLEEKMLKVLRILACSESQQSMLYTQEQVYIECPGDMRLLPLAQPKNGPEYLLFVGE